MIFEPSFPYQHGAYTPAEQPQKITLRRRQVKTAEGTIPHKYLYEWRAKGNNWYLINDKNVLPLKRTPDGFAEARHVEQQVLDGETVVCSAIYQNKKLYIGKLQHVED